MSNELNHEQSSAIFAELIKIVGESEATKALLAIENKLKPLPSYSEIFWTARKECADRDASYFYAAWDLLSQNQMENVAAGIAAVFEESKKRGEFNEPSIDVKPTIALLVELRDYGGPLSQQARLLLNSEIDRLRGLND